MKAQDVWQHEGYVLPGHADHFGARMITIVKKLSSDGFLHGAEPTPLIARRISFWHEVDVVPADRTTSVALNVGKVWIECFRTLRPYDNVLPGVISTQPEALCYREGIKAYKGRANSSDAALAGCS